MDEITVSTDIDAPPDLVYDLVSDLPRMGQWSPECERCDWKPSSSGAAVGAEFRGHNRHGRRTWSTSGRVVVADRGREFSFEISSVFGLPVSRWTYRIDPSATGCTVTESTLDRRGRLIKVLGGVATGVKDRGEHNRKTMKVTLEQLKRAAESAAVGSS